MSLRRRTGMRRRAAALLGGCWESLAFCLEALVSRRGLAVAFLALAALWTCSGWVRPPLNRDLSATHLPLRFLFGGGPSPVDLLDGPRQVVWDSLGVVLLIFIAISAVVLLRRPERLRTIAGVLLVVAVAANAAIAWNHPALFELLVAENVQRDQMVQVLQSQKENCLVNPENGRVPYDQKSQGDPAGLLGSWDYLLYGIWLVALSVLGILDGGRRPLVRRLGTLAAWAALAAAVACTVCLPRLWGEFCWRRATQLEAKADFAASRQALQEAASICPELGRLQRAWLLKGTLDFRQGLSSPERQFWTASQLALRNQFADAGAIMEQLHATHGEELVVGRQTADLLTARGLVFFGKGERGAAADAFQKAADAAPWRLDSAFYFGLIYGRWDRQHPERAESQLTRFLTRCADYAFRADVLNVLGDVYFEAGQMAHAHQLYDQSFRLFNMPKLINYRAQRGLGGM